MGKYTMEQRKAMHRQAGRIVADAARSVDPSGRRKKLAKAYAKSLVDKSFS